MKKIWQALTGTSDKKKKPEQLVGVPLESKPIQSRENLRKGKALIGVPFMYSPMVWESYPSSNPSPERESRSRTPPTPPMYHQRLRQPQQYQQQYQRSGGGGSLNSPWNQLIAIDNTVETMRTRLELIDNDLTRAFDTLGIRRGKEEGARVKQKQKQNLIQVDWTSSGIYNIKIPVGSDINPDDISVNIDHGALVICFKNTGEGEGEGKGIGEVTKKIPLPENIDSTKMKIIWKPQGYLLVEAPLLSKQQPVQEKSGYTQQEDGGPKTAKAFSESGYHKQEGVGTGTKTARVSSEKDDWKSKMGRFLPSKDERTGRFGRIYPETQEEKIQRAPRSSPEKEEKNIAGRISPEKEEKGRTTTTTTGTATGNNLPENEEKGRTVTTTSGGGTGKMSPDKEEKGRTVTTTTGTGKLSPHKEEKGGTATATTTGRVSLEKDTNKFSLGHGGKEHTTRTYVDVTREGAVNGKEKGTLSPSAV